MSSDNTCWSCHGEGRFKCNCDGGSWPCPSCNGNGEHDTGRTLGYKQHAVMSECRRCGGWGIEPCRKCGGAVYQECRKCGGTGEYPPRPGPAHPIIAERDAGAERRRQEESHAAVARTRSEALQAERAAELARIREEEEEEEEEEEAKRRYREEHPLEAIRDQSMLSLTRSIASTRETVLSLQLVLKRKKDPSERRSFEEKLAELKLKQKRDEEELERLRTERRAERYKEQERLYTERTERRAERYKERERLYTERTERRAERYKEREWLYTERTERRAERYKQ